MSARRRVKHCQQLLQEIGLEPERVRMFNMSSAMAMAFVEAARQMTEQVAAVGPNPLRRLQEDGDRASTAVAGE